MQPFRSVRSEAELLAVSTDSHVCPAHHPASVYQKGSGDQWVEPGDTHVWSTASLWEFSTGSYDGYVPDEEREMWVLYDSDAQHAPVPPRPAGTHDYATRILTRDPEMMQHATLAEARAAIEESVGDGATVGHTNIWVRQPGEYVFNSNVHIPHGTKAADLPWAVPYTQHENG